MNPRYGMVGLFLVGMVVWLGCGPDNPLGRKAVNGTVNFNGKPLAKGTITFYPTKGEPVMSGAQIVEGGYSIRADKGLTPGEYGVKISSPDHEHMVNPTPGGVTIIPELIPPEYNEKSQQKVTVAADGPNEFNFDIKAQ